MDLFEIDETQHLRREEAAARLRHWPTHLPGTTRSSSSAAVSRSPCGCPTRST